MAESETKKGRIGVGWRYCAECDFSTKGPRSEKCGNCGKAFVKKSGQATSEQVLASLDRTSEPSNQEAAMEFVRSVGGLSAAKEALADLEALKKTFSELKD